MPSLPDPADPWVRGMLDPIDPKEDHTVGMPFKDKLLVVRWLMEQYNVSLDDAMKHADAMERYMEKNR